jgi:general nucleoside transport system permease protein
MAQAEDDLMSGEFMDALWGVLASTLRVSTPLLFAALGGLVSERAGVINIALEGMMLIGAFAAAGVAIALQGSAMAPWAGAMAAVIAGAAIAAIYAASVIPLRANQIVAGTAINMLAAGLTPFLSKALYGSTIGTPALPLESRFVSAPVWLAWICVVVIWAWMYRTPSGSWVRFAGENPAALDAAGIRVNRVRWTAVLASGCLAGLGGASLSIFLSSSFARQMTAGRGFMALAALIFGKWRPLPAAAACLFFGFTDAMQIRLQGVVLWGEEPVPVQFIQILPYAVTVLVLAGFVGQSRAPKALGLPFEKR